MKSLNRRYLAVIVSIVAAVFIMQIIAIEAYGMVAGVEITPAQVTFSPKVPYAKIDLTVAVPDGTVQTFQYEYGNAPSFSAATYGATLPDGQYAYELRVTAPGTLMNRTGDEVYDITVTENQGPVSTASSVQSGSFHVVGHAFVPNGVEPVTVRDPVKSSTASQSTSGTITPLDVVNADDFIIQGSTCVGLDCVNNESFGFDTIRLKENNTRIVFNDSSLSAGFPNRTWRLRANDSPSGGLNAFYIDDLGAPTTTWTGSETSVATPFAIVAGAPDNALYVSSTGRVGFRTATPVLDIHINTADTPAVRLDQNASGGFTPQVWDVAGNEANFFVRDVTGGSRLPFRIRPGAPTSSIDIAADGNVGIGTSSPQSTLHVMGTLTLDSVAQASSRTYKDNILALTAHDALTTLKGLTPVTFNYKRDTRQQHVGFIAEDVPESVTNPEKTAILPLDIVAVLTKVVQEQQNTIEKQNQILMKQEKKLAALSSKIKKLEKSHR